MNYKADTEYDLMYIDNKFNEHNYTLKPDEDMNTPQVILELQANCDDFFKLVEDDEKLQEDYINLDDVQSLQVKDKNVIAYEMDLYLDTDGDRYRLLKSYANMLDRKPSILWVGFSNEEVADLTPNLGEIDDNAKKFGYKYNMQVATDNLDYNEITHKLNNITNDVAIGGNWLYVDDIHRIDKDDIRNKAVQNMLYENKKLNGGVEKMKKKSIKIESIDMKDLNDLLNSLEQNVSGNAEFKAGYKDGLNHIKNVINEYNNFGKKYGGTLLSGIENKYSELGTDTENLSDEYVKGIHKAFEDIMGEVEYLEADDLFKNIFKAKPSDIEHIGDNCFKYKDLYIELRPDTITNINDAPEMDFAIFKTESDMNTDYELNIGTDYGSMLVPHRYWESVKSFCDRVMESNKRESKQIKTEAVENNVRLGFKDIVVDVLQGALEDGTITEVTDELITKCVDALEDEDELYDLIIGIIYDTIENKEVKTEAKESEKEYTCIEDRQGGDWAVGDTMTAEEWGERAAGWAYADNWEDSDEPLLKNFKTEQDCIDFICDIWEITIVPSNDPRAKEFLSENKQVVVEAKLTDADKKLLADWGEDEEGIAQVERALNLTKFTVSDVEKDENGRTIIPDELDDKPISAKEARKILGDRNFMSGLDRSAFHWTCGRFNDDETKYVSFDSSKLFKESK